MSSLLPDPERTMEPPAPASPWSIVDLIVFVVFFGVTFFFLPLGFMLFRRVLNPSFRVSDVTASEQIVLQGVMDLILVGFIFFLTRVVHRQSFIKTIRWYRNHNFSSGFLISLGAALAISVIVLSTFFPPKEPPPIERFLSSTQSIAMFALFGVGVAPLFEEVIFRGFLFKVLMDIGGPRTAVTVTALLFASLHLLQLWGSWASVALILVVGYVLSVVRLRADSLIPSFVIHTAYNGMLFCVFAVSTLVQKSGVP